MEMRMPNIDDEDRLQDQAEQIPEHADEPLEGWAVAGLSIAAVGACIALAYAAVFGIIHGAFG